MPKRTDIQSILIIGAGPIVIGQACEFDYSGAQACKALREEGYRVILVNSNPATIMTDPEMADAIYIEPINWQTRRAHHREGAAGCAAADHGRADRAQHRARPGARRRAREVRRRADRRLARGHRHGRGPRAVPQRDARDRARDARSRRSRAASRRRSPIAGEIGLPGRHPPVLHPRRHAAAASPTTARSSRTSCARGLDASPTSEVLIEESVIGWKEFEMEVVRDHKDNCIIVCSIENLDPMGVHTGDSITVAPAQTLTDKEYQRMRDASIAVLRKIGVDTGGSNVQFAVNPKDGRLLVIEMNPRVSRSSALASKATGFPIAKIAAKLAVGYTLDELQERHHRRRDAGLVRAVDRLRGHQDPALHVREVPGRQRPPDHADEVGRRGDGHRPHLPGVAPEGAARPRDRARRPRRAAHDAAHRGDRGQAAPTSCARRAPNRLLYVADAFRAGWSLERSRTSSRSIDPWFLAQIEDLVREEARGARRGPRRARAPSACACSSARASPTAAWRDLVDMPTRRRSATSATSSSVRPVYKRVDTCAAEFATTTAYLYSTYEEECEAQPTDRRKIMILGGGPNRIGQGIEFDYCCVHAALRCARTASRPSWSTATRRPSRPTTTPPTGCTSSR